MLDRFAQENMLDDKLSKMDADKLNRLYLQVFNSDTGLLVLRDMENRSFVNFPADTPVEEGIRRAYVTILTRMKNATKGGNDEKS